MTKFWEEETSNGVAYDPREAAILIPFLFMNSKMSSSCCLNPTCMHTLHLTLGSIE